jgi:exodeoxyribonuclease V alpha subunit
MKTMNDVHQQFAAYFESDNLEPYAYLLSRKLAEGNTCVPLDSLSPADEQLLTERFPSFVPSIPALLKDPLVATGTGGYEPFVIHNNKLYLHRYFQYETLLLRRILDFVAEEKECYNERVALLNKHKGFIGQLFEDKQNTAAVTNWPVAAAISGSLNNFTIITGGPGTGKTTTVAKILAILFTIYPTLKVALAAPTGKAAARMADSLKHAKLPTDTIQHQFQGLVPSTIHRLLKPISGTPHFKHNSSNPLDVDVLIVDESSMIDVALFAKLLDAAGPATRVILLGDKDQLASVEAGSLFGDLCQAQPALNEFTNERRQLVNSFIAQPARQVTASVPADAAHPLFQHVIELRQSHRFNDEQGIGRFSKAVIKNDVPVIESFFDLKADEQVTIDPGYDTRLFNQFIHGYEAYINEKEIGPALKKLNQLRVLCALREGEFGLHAINRRIEERLQQIGLIRRPGEFYENRPIMITSNNYELGLFNGDIGLVRKNEKGVTMAWFEDAEGNLKTVLPGYIAQAETVFAMTIHKSQGSEFNQVLLVLPEKTGVNLLTRELLYTGITRAKEKLVVQASKTVILQAASEQVKRSSGMIDRLTEQNKV